MSNEAQPRRPAGNLRRSWQLRALFAVALIWLAPTLACGSFAPRPTPTPTLPPIAAETTSQGTEAAPVVQLQNTPIPLAATETPTPEATPTFTPTALPGTALAVGQPARVVAPNGLNLREQPTSGATLIRLVPPRAKVTVVEGPTSADGFTWWKVDDGEGNVGWLIQSDGETELLSPQMGAPEPVDRAPRVGERVLITMPTGELSVRLTPGTDAEIVTRVAPGQEFTVLGGPQEASGYTWYQIRSDDGATEGWAADGDGTERWLSPLE
jgi:uncharacterized protein YgiM (DUF1202 family)